MTIDPVNQAFPFTYSAAGGEKGLTVRAHFASLAMQGLCSNPSIVDTKGGAVWIAIESLRVADALIAELNKP